MTPPRLAWLIGLISAILKLILVWSGLTEKSLLCDDAYYYFTIAANLASGLGPTFDGLAATNGFHPLWQVLLVPVFHDAPANLWLPVRVALSLTVFFDLISGWLILGILRQTVNERLAVGAAIMWYVMAPTALLGLRGMESSLSTLLLLGLIFLLTNRREFIGAGNYRIALIAGLILGLCGLARTDNLPMGGLALASVLWLATGPAGPGRRFRSLVVAALAALMVVLPWFIWNLVKFQSLIQVSGQVKYHVTDLFGRLPWGWWDFPAAGITILNMLFPSVMVSGVFFSGEEFEGGSLALPLSLVTLAGVLLILIRGFGSRKDPSLVRRVDIVFPAAWLLVHTVLFGFIWRSYAAWYSQGYFALLIVMLAGLLGSGGFAAQAWKRLAGGALALVFLAQLTYYPLFFNRLPHLARGPEKQFDQPLQRILTIKPEGATLGAFDAGALGYVALKYPRLHVVNLDGLVNNRIFAASREGRYADYLIENVDFVLQDVKRTSMYLEPEEVERLLRYYGQR